MAGDGHLLGDISDLLRIESPKYLEATLDSGTFVSGDYAQIQEGFQLEQSINEYFGIFLRATAFQIFQNQIDQGRVLVQDPDGDVSLLFPLSTPSSQLFFGRFQAGFDFYLTPDTSLQFSGGSDAGDDSSPLIEADLTTWLFVHRRHPIQLSLASLYAFQQRNTSSSISIDTVVRSTANWLLMAGTAGSIFNSSFVSGVGSTPQIPEGEPTPLMVKIGSGQGSLGGQGGADFNAVYRPWQSALGIQFGYGTSGYYGEIAISKQLGFLD